MKIVVSAKSQAAADQLRPMVDGMAKCDETVVWERGDYMGWGDVVLTMSDVKIGAHVRGLGMHHLVVELGFLGDRHASLYAGWDGLNGNGAWPVRSGAGEPSYGLLRPWKVRGWYETRRALVLAQCPGDANMSKLKWKHYQPWLEAVVGHLKKMGCEVRYRSHPKHSGMKLCSLDTEEDRGSRTLEEDLEWAQAAVGFSSNALLDAAIAGVPVVCASKQAMAWGVGGTLSVMHLPDTEARQIHLDYVASAQWGREQMGSGEAWLSLRYYLETKR